MKLASQDLGGQWLPVDFTAFDPSRLQQLGLADILPGAPADRRLHPSLKAARMDAQTPAPRPNGEFPRMLSYERASHFASLAKHAVTFLEKPAVSGMGANA